MWCWLPGLRSCIPSVNSLAPHAHTRHRRHHGNTKEVRCWARIAGPVVVYGGRGSGARLNTSCGGTLEKGRSSCEATQYIQYRTVLFGSAGPLKAKSGVEENRGQLNGPACHRRWNAFVSTHRANHERRPGTALIRAGFDAATSPLTFVEGCARPADGNFAYMIVFRTFTSTPIHL